MSRFDDPSLQIHHCCFGAVLIALGIASTLIVLRQFLRPRGDHTPVDPWDGRTLEWSTSSPATRLQLCLHPRGA
jgi:cytochrome o ubiquinol oxidase subunit 1